MERNPRIRDRMRPLDGCTPGSSAREVARVMDEMGLRFMPVVGGAGDRRITGAVSRNGLMEAIRVAGDSSARVQDARLLSLPRVEPDLQMDRLEERAGLAAAYVVADGDRLLGLYDPGEGWR